MKAGGKPLTAKQGAKIVKQYYKAAGKGSSGSSDPTTSLLKYLTESGK